MIDYDSFSHCHLTDIFFRYFRASKRVKTPVFFETKTTFICPNQAKSKHSLQLKKSTFTFLLNNLYFKMFTIDYTLVLKFIFYRK